MRKNIFELLKNTNINLKKEYQQLYTLFEKTSFYTKNSICEYINYYTFREWKYRNRYIDIKDMMSDLNISIFDMLTLDKLNLNTLLLYIEFIINVISTINTFEIYPNDTKLLNTLKENIFELVEDLNYEICCNEDFQHIIIEKNSLTSAVAEIIPSITNLVIEYRRFNLKGDIESKRSILKELADKIEPLNKKFKSTEFNNFIEDIGTLLNNLNIRHNNIEGKNKKQYIVDMKSEELEEWYDKTYDMILVALLIDKYIDDKSKIKELKEHLKYC